MNVADLNRRISERLIVHSSPNDVFLPGYEWRDMGLAIDGARKLGWSLQIEMSKYMWRDMTTVTVTDRQDRVYTASNTSTPMAVCLALMAAIEDIGTVLPF